MKSRWTKKQSCLFSLSLLACLSLAAYANEQIPTSSRLGQLALRINQQSAAVREDFARVAIEEVVISLQFESELAQLQAQSSSKNRRWSAATRDYARQLAIIAKTLSENSQIRLSVGREQTVFIYLDDRMVVLSNPRAEEQTDMERRIIERFCSAQPCQEWQAAEVLTATAPLTPRPPVWTFGDGGNYSCSNGEGLILEFSDMLHMAEKKAFCQQLFSELYTLINALRARLYQGEKIDWNELQIQGVPGDDHQRVLLGTQAEVMWLVLPTCAAQPQVFARLQPWLKSRAHGTGSTLTIKHVEQLLLAHVENQSFFMTSHPRHPLPVDLTSAGASVTMTYLR